MKRACRAYTLVEVVTALSIFSVIFATVAVTVHALYETSGGLADRIATAAQQRRFAAQLRFDTHGSWQAHIVAPSPDAPTTVLTLSLAGGHNVEYRLYPHRIERRLRRDETVTHVDSYRLSPVLEHGWQLHDNRASPLLDVLLYQETAIQPPLRDALPPVRIRAALQIACLPNGSTMPEG